MRNLILTALLILAFAGVSNAYVEVNNNGKIITNYQKATGGLISSSALTTIAGGATVITGIVVTSGSSANVVQLFDDSATATAGFEVGVPAAGASNTVFEGGSAANTSTFFDLSQTPIRTVNGLESSAANTTGGSYIVYTIQYP